MGNFQVVADSRNELQEILDTMGTEGKDDAKLASMATINRWENDMFDRIRRVASQLREDVNERLAQQLLTMRQKFDQVSKDIQQRYKRGNYLENDIESVRQELAQLSDQIKSIDKDVQIHVRKSDIDWNQFIYIVQPATPSRPSTKSLVTERVSTNAAPVTNAQSATKNASPTTVQISMCRASRDIFGSASFYFREGNRF